MSYFSGLKAIMGEPCRMHLWQTSIHRASYHCGYFERLVRRSTTMAFIGLMAGGLAAFGGVSAVSADEVKPLVHPSFSEDYTLAPQDRIRVRVFEWRVGGYFEWEALNGEYAVDSAGAVTLPLIGRMEAMALTTSQLADNVSRLMQAKAGLKKTPQTSVEIIQYRPVYIVGDVQNPGEYAYRPGMTAVRSLAVAGGVFRLQGMANEFRENVSSAGRLEQAELRLRRMYARRARLIAEKDTIESGVKEFPEVELDVSVGNSLALDLILRDEQHIMKARLGELFDNEERLKEMLALYTQEQNTLKEKLANQEGQVKLARESAADAERLFERRLVSTARRISAKTLVTQLESSRLDLESELLRTRQQQSNVSREINDARATMMAQISTDLQETESNIEILKSQISAEKAQLTLASRSGLSHDLVSNEETGPRVIYLIKRGSVAKANLVALEANEDTQVYPGDVIQVKVVSGKKSGSGTAIDARDEKTEKLPVIKVKKEAAVQHHQGAVKPKRKLAAAVKRIAVKQDPPSESEPKIEKEAAAQILIEPQSFLKQIKR